MLDAHLHLSIPKNQDLVIAHMLPQDRVTLIKRLLLHEANHFLDSQLIETAQIRNIVNELLPLHHVFIVISVHVLV